MSAVNSVQLTASALERCLIRKIYRKQAGANVGVHLNHDAVMETKALMLTLVYFQLTKSIISY